MPFTAQQIDTDRELAARLRTGCKEAFAAIYEQYAPVLLGFVMKLAGEKAVAEDILQRSFVTVWENRLQSGTQPLGNWLLRIAREASLSVTKITEKKENQNEQALVDIYNPISNGMTPEHRKLQNAVFELVYYHGFSLTDVAPILNVEINTLKTMLRSAVNNLKTPVI